MNKTFYIAFIAITFITLFSASASANTTIAVECASCNTYSDFRNAALNQVSANPAGDYSVYIVNETNQTEIWNVQLNVEWSAQHSEQSGTYILGEPQTTIISAHRASSEVEESYDELVKLTKKPITINLDDSDNLPLFLEECSTVRVTRCGFISAYLRGLPSTNKFFQENVAQLIWRKLLNKTKMLKFSVVWPDGGRITYEISIEDAAVTPTLAFSTVSNSIVNADGTVGNGGGTFFDDVGTNGKLFSVPGPNPGNSVTCDLWVFVTRTNGVVTNVEFKCL